MFNFFHTIFVKITSLVASAIIAVGLVSIPEEPLTHVKDISQEVINTEMSTSTATTSEQATSAPKKTIEEQKQTPQLQKTEIPKPPTVKTFTLPNGAIIDEAGNIISGPTNPTVPTTNTDITAGIRVLSGEEIYSLISPSVVLITSSKGHGTGFFVENGKYVITNAHVVGSDSEVMITFQVGTSITGQVLGKNDTLDIALIYSSFGRKAVKFGRSDSSNLKTGADVYALGFPLDFTNTVTITKGLVSANRQQVSNSLYIQTDASIHPGNSGGPLVNNKGEVVGINTAVVAAEGKIGLIGGTGIGFAIPIETAENLIPSLSQYGQNRYEVYPIGSTFNIKRSLLIRIGMNDTLSCSQLQFIGDDLILCNLYKNYKNDYKWNIIEDTQ